MPKLPRKRRSPRRRQVQSLPRHGVGGRTRPAAAEPLDWVKYAKGTTGCTSQVPPECVAKSDTGSGDDMWLRTKLTEPPVPEDLFVPPTNALQDLMNTDLRPGWEDAR